MLLNLQSIVSPTYSTIDKTRILTDFKPALPAEYTLTEGDTVFNKVGGPTSSSRSFEVTARPRPGKFVMKVRFNNLGGGYGIVMITQGLAGEQVGYTNNLPANTWNEIKIEHVSGNIYRYLVNGSSIYQGVATNLTFYGHTGVTKMEIDTGQLGSALPAGYLWY